MYAKVLFVRCRLLVMCFGGRARPEWVIRIEWRFRRRQSIHVINITGPDQY